MKEKYLFVSDIDDTLLGNNQALAELMSALDAVHQRVIVVYNSSRPCNSIQKSIAEQIYLLQPDYLIGALGTEMQSENHPEIADAYTRQWGNWKRDEIAAIMAEMGFTAHADEYQTPFKASYNVPDVSQYQRVLENLKSKGIEAKIIYSNQKDLDIIPDGAGKGTAAEFVRRLLGIEIERVIVAGDSANDREMFLHSFKGIVVANADSSLKSLNGSLIYHARKEYAAGVIEGLKHWGVLGKPNG